MTDENQTNYQNNPLHGVGLKQMLEELVSHYGFQILFAYLNINCFKTNPTIMASVKFLKKTTWAREKVEVFYLYRYKNLPNPSSEQFKQSPRDRVIPAHQQVGEPQALSLEDAEQEQQKRERRSAAHNKRPHGGKPFGNQRNIERRRVTSGQDGRSSSNYNSKRSSNQGSTNGASTDPWANARKKIQQDDE